MYPLDSPQARADGELLKLNTAEGGINSHGAFVTGCVQDSTLGSFLASTSCPLGSGRDMRPWLCDLALTMEAGDSGHWAAGASAIDRVIRLCEEKMSTYVSGYDVLQLCLPPTFSHTSSSRGLIIRSGRIEQGRLSSNAIGPANLNSVFSVLARAGDASGASRTIFNLNAFSNAYLERNGISCGIDDISPPPVTYMVAAAYLRSGSSIVPFGDPSFEMDPRDLYEKSVRCRANQAMRDVLHRVGKGGKGSKVGLARSICAAGNEVTSDTVNAITQVLQGSVVVIECPLFPDETPDDGIARVYDGAKCDFTAIFHYVKPSTERVAVACALRDENDAVVLADRLATLVPCVKMCHVGQTMSSRGLIPMVASGSKGKAKNIGSMMGSLGLQNLPAVAQGLTFSDRQLPHSLFGQACFSECKTVDIATENYFITQSLSSGLSPKEMWMMEKAGRTGVVMIVENTRAAGTITRKLVGALPVTIGVTGSVLLSSAQKGDRIVQMTWDGTGYDSARTSHGGDVLRRLFANIDNVARRNLLLPLNGHPDQHTLIRVDETCRRIEALLAMDGCGPSFGDRVALEFKSPVPFQRLMTDQPTHATLPVEDLAMCPRMFVLHQTLDAHSTVMVASLDAKVEDIIDRVARWCAGDANGVLLQIGAPKVELQVEGEADWHSTDCLARRFECHEGALLARARLPVAYQRTCSLGQMGKPAIRVRRAMSVEVVRCVAILKQTASTGTFQIEVLRAQLSTCALSHTIGAALHLLQDEHASSITTRPDQGDGSIWECHSVLQRRIDRLTHMAVAPPTGSSRASGDESDGNRLPQLLNIALRAFFSPAYVERTSTHSIEWAWDIAERSLLDVDILLAAGTSVGVRSAQDMSADVTQKTLSAFHESGAEQDDTSSALTTLLNMTPPEVNGRSEWSLGILHGTPKVVKAFVKPVYGKDVFNGQDCTIQYKPLDDDSDTPVIWSSIAEGDEEDGAECEEGDMVLMMPCAPATPKQVCVAVSQALTPNKHTVRMRYGPGGNPNGVCVEVRVRLHTDAAKHAPHSNPANDTPNMMCLACGCSITIPRKGVGYGCIFDGDARGRLSLVDAQPIPMMKRAIESLLFSTGGIFATLEATLQDGRSSLTLSRCRETIQLIPGFSSSAWKDCGVRDLLLKVLPALEALLLPQYGYAWAELTLPDIATDILSSASIASDPGDAANGCITALQAAIRHNSTFAAHSLAPVQTRRVLRATLRQESTHGCAVSKPFEFDGMLYVPLPVSMWEIDASRNIALSALWKPATDCDVSYLSAALRVVVAHFHLPFDADNYPQSPEDATSPATRDRLFKLMHALRHTPEHWSFLTLTPLMPQLKTILALAGVSDREKIARIRDMEWQGRDAADPRGRPFEPICDNATAEEASRVLCVLTRLEYLIVNGADTPQHAQNCQRMQIPHGRCVYVDLDPPDLPDCRSKLDRIQYGYMHGTKTIQEEMKALQRAHEVVKCCVLSGIERAVVKGRTIRIPVKRGTKTQARHTATDACALLITRVCNACGCATAASCEPGDDCESCGESRGSEPLCDGRTLIPAGIAEASNLLGIEAGRRLFVNRMTHLGIAPLHAVNLLADVLTYNGAPSGISQSAMVRNGVKDHLSAAMQDTPRQNFRNASTSGAIMPLSTPATNVLVGQVFNGPASTAVSSDPVTRKFDNLNSFGERSCVNALSPIDTAIFRGDGVFERVGQGPSRLPAMIGEKSSTRFSLKRRHPV